MKKQPEKTARTKQNMIDVFWKLAEEKGFDKVTASALAKEAGVNRATFYSYFTDMDDLVFQAEEQILTDMCTKIVFCQALFPKKSVKIPCFRQGIFPTFGGY